MKMRFAFVLVAILALSMVAGTALAAPAGPTGGQQHSGILLQPEGATGSALYIVQLSAPPLASYYGGIESLAATSPRVTGERKLNMESDASIAYMNYLDGVQVDMLSTINQTLDRDVAVSAQWNVAYNGFAIEITPEEAAEVVALDGVNIVQREFMRYPQTDVGPEWIGADMIWNGSATGSQFKGEGVLVGVVDTGINLGHPSFAQVGGDGYVHTNPLGSGTFLGLCASNPGTYVCNNKTIGFYIFTGETTEDGDGHGSHTASTTAGNYLQQGTVDLTPYNQYSPAISGVAPHANIISYKACLDVGGCPGSALVSSINQATANGVDVINYSIGGGTSNPWSDADALAFLAAQDAGVVPVTSAGNSGPSASTVGSPGDAPWVLTVGASTHNRAGVNALVDMSGGDTTPPIDLIGKSFSLGTGPTPVPIVYAGNYGDALCLNPFSPGTFTGQIVVCDRGTNARVAKGYNVLQGGAGGMVLANTNPGDSLNGDVHWLPAVQLDSVQGTALKTWLASGSGHVGTIEGTTLSFDPANGDIMAGFSSRGPLVNNASDIIKPDVTAPGVDIIAAYRDYPPDDENPTRNYAVVSGTSMSSPHTAGAAALLSGLYPDWTPSEIKSALMSTGKVTGVVKEDGVTQADPFDMGGGRVQVDQGAQAGLLFNVAAGAYQAANPGAGGDPKTLNIASLGNDDCGGICIWHRTVEAVDDGTWTTGWSAAAGMTINVQPASFTLNAGETQAITVTANVGALPLGVWAFGEVTLTPGVVEGNGFAAQHLPVAVKPSSSTPIIDVNPSSLSSTQAPDAQHTEVLNVGNVGTANLDWTIFEDNGSAPELVDWSDNFDSYATGSQLIGQGGWEGWGDNAAAGALTSSTQARSAPNSADINGDSDLVHQYSGYTSGSWMYTAWQYVPGNFTGESYFILLNEYTSAGGGDGNWSTQVRFNSATGQVLADGIGSSFPPLPLITDQWVELRVEINLDADTQTFYYGNQVLYTGSWSDGVSGGGSINIAAVDLFANGASTVYYDDLSLVAAVAACSAPNDIPWASVNPTAGTTTPGNSIPVDVTFDSTGLANGTYNGTLCVTSNDPATPLVQVPLELTVSSDVPNIDVNPLSLESTQATNQSTNQALTIANTGGGTLDWVINEEDTTAPVASLPRAPKAQPVVTSSDQCALYENYTGMEPEGYSRFCVVPQSQPEGNAPEAPTDTAYALDVRNDRFVQFTLNNFPGQTLVGAQADAMYGLDFNPTATTLYALNDATDELGTLNLATGAFTAIVACAAPGGVNWTGLSIDPVSGTFYASTATDLYTLNPATCSPVLIGSFGTTLMIDIAVNTAGVMYGHDIGTDSIYTINTATGVATLVGPTGYAANFAQGMDFDNDDGTLYIFVYTGGGTNTYGTVNLATGAVTPLAQDNPLGEFEGATQTVGLAQPCSVPSDIPWLTLSTAAGSNGGGTNTGVTVTFDSTGLANGVYTGNLCVTSNDPDAGPGNGTDLVVVPVTLTVRPPTAVALTDLAAGVDEMPAPLGGVPLGAVAAAGMSMALAAGYVLRRKRA